MEEGNDPTHLISKKATLIRQTEDEKSVVQNQAETEGTEEVNIWRRAMREYLEKRGLLTSEKLFSDRGPGNRLPKPKGKETALAIAS